MLSSSSATQQAVINVDMDMLDELEAACNQISLRPKSQKIFNNLFYSVKSPLFLSVSLGANYLKVESSKYGTSATSGNSKKLGQVILMSNDLQAFMSHVLKKLLSHLPSKMIDEYVNFDYESDDRGHVYMKVSEKVQIFNANKRLLKTDSWIFGHYNAKFMIQVYGIYLYTSEDDDHEEKTKKKMAKLSAKIVQILCIEKAREPEFLNNNLPCLF